MLKISIVTVAYNEVANIKSTMNSVLGQAYPNIEYVVQDGGSADGTVREIENFANEVKAKPEVEQRRFSLKWESERDGGIYFGMNNGLRKCTGDYVLFCNAGDRLAANDVIEKLVKKAEADGLPDLVYGDCANAEKGELLIHPAHGPGFIRFGMPASHEAMLYKLSLVKALGLRYDTSYRIAADYKFTCQFVSAAKSFAYVQTPVVVFSAGGVSTVNQWRGLMEASRVRKEVGVPLVTRMTVVAMQCCALLLSRYARPIYKLLLRARQICRIDDVSILTYN